MTNKFSCFLTQKGRWLTATLFLLFSLGIGQMWGDCDGGTTIFSLAMKTQSSNVNIPAKSGGVDGTLDVSTYSTLNSGSSANLYSSESSAKKAITTTPSVTFNTANIYMVISFTCDLAEGDLITIERGAKSKQIQFADSKSGTKVATVNYKYAIPSGSDLIGKSTIYVFGYNGGEGDIKNMSIIRPYTVTLTPGDGATCSTASVKCVPDGSVALTHAFKSNMHFKGWYTSSTGGTKVNNYYAATSDVELFAQFEAFPESGDLFTLEMEDGLKPASNCTIKTASGYASQVDMLTYATIDGGAAFFKNASSNNHAIITTGGKFNFAGSNAIMEIPLDFALQNGDEIQTDFSEKIWVSSSTTKPSTGPYVDGDNKNYTVTEGDGLKDATILYLYTGTSGATASSITITRPVPAATYTVTLNPAGGTIASVPSGWSLTDGKYVKSGIEDGSSVTLLALTKDGYKLNGWKDGENADYTSPVTIDGADLTLTAQWAQTYAVTYVPDNGTAETMTDNNAPYKAGDEVTLLTNTFTAPVNKEFDAWVVTETVSGDPVAVSEGKFTMPAATVTVTATWKDACALAPTVSATTLGTTSYTTQVVNCAGISVLGSAGCTISEYGFVYGTTTAPTTSNNKKALEGDYTVAGTAFPATTLTGLAMNTKYYVRAYATNSFGTAYGDEVNFTTLAALGNVLVVASSASQTSDAITALRDNGFVVTVSAPNNSRDYTGYDLVVLDESLDGKNGVAEKEEGDIKGVNIPLLNMKAFFYTLSSRWNWGTPVNGTSGNEIANISEAYCNAQDHPIFAGLTINEGAIDLIDPAKSGNTLQGVTTNTLVEGKVGYTLATSGTGISFIHELTPSQRGVADAKYLMIAISNNAKDNLSADGEKLIVNAAKYLVGSTSWTPIVTPTSPEVTATPSAAYSVGDNIALTASATGAVATTTYTWYKGATWAAAEEAGAIKAAATAAAGGNTFGVTGCAAGDAGIYWCVISNGTGCDAKASLEVTVSSVSYNIAFVSAHGTAPTATTGVSYSLPELSASGWEHQGWTASIDVTVDAATVDAGTLIANGKVASFAEDVTFTAVWKQEFQVTFNLKGHGDPIAQQVVVDGELATDPGDPAELGYDFGGWFTNEECTAGNEFSFSTPITATTPLYAKWTAFTGCVEVYPAASGDALTVDATVALQSGSTGATIKVANLNGEKSIDYNASGLSFSGGGKDSVRVTLNNDLQVGSVITVRLVSNGTTHSSGRGLNLFNAAHVKKALLGWQADEEVAKYDELSFSYTVTETDGFAGTNIIGLSRQNSVFLKSLKVTNCGAAIIYHDLTSAITPDHDPAYATVTLGASSVREGYTTTAEYSAIDAAYEFDEWQISGTGASIADASANPAVITMGTADAVVTLKLKAATPKHTVTYDVKGHGVAPVSEDVKEGSKVTKPADPSETGWAFCGWYKETTLENAWNFDVNVMGTENITLYAKWEDETSAIKLFDGEGNLNTAKFITPAKTTIEINTVEYPTLVSFGSNRTSLSQAKQADMVMYSAATDATKIKFELYNANSSAKDVYLWLVEEGDADATAVATVNVPGETRITTSYYTFNGTKNRSFYLTSGSKADVKVMQVTVLDNGNDIPQFGKAGYSVDFNKGRIASAASGTISFEGATIGVKSEYTVLNSTSLSLNTYIQFDNAVANTVVKIKKASTNKYYVTNNLESKGTEYSTDQEVALTTTGTWYIGSVNSGSAAALSKIEFIAPKCEEPTITTMVNSDLCQGDAFAPLTVSASVSDGGTLHYQWYKHPAAGDDEAVGTDAASYTPTADGQYYVVVTNKLTNYSDNSATSNTIAVTHFASAQITTAPLNQRGPKDAVVTLTVAATGKNVAYKWYTCTNEAGDGEVALDPVQTGTTLNVTITEGMNQWYKVKVSSDCGGVEATANVSQFVPATPANVTESIVWDWNSSAWPASGQVAFTGQVEDGTDLTPAYELLADADAIVPNNAAFRSDMLYGKGQWVWRSGNKFFQGTAIKFNTTVAGKVRVNYRSTGNNKEVQVTIAGTPAGKNKTSNFQWSEYVEVPAGDVEIICLSTDAEKSLTRVQKIEFYALAHQRTTGYNAGDLGTVCLEDATFIEGANLYELAGLNENGYLAFDQVDPAELEAGKPYLFEVTNPSKISFYKPVGAAHTDTEVTTGTKGMIGTFAGTTLNQNVTENYYYFSGRHIWRVNDFTVGITIPAHRCYVDYDAVQAADPAQAPAAGRRRVTLGVQGKGTATDINNVEGDNVQPVKMMINGQLFILRGEKLYDATGRLVK